MNAFEMYHFKQLMIRLNSKPVPLEIGVELYACKDDGEQFSLNVGIVALCPCR